MNLKVEGAIMKKKLRISLVSYVAFITATLTAVAMGVYAVYQFNSNPGHTVWGLIMQHGWHVVVLGFLTYVVLYPFFFYQIHRPIMKLWVKAYAISKGHDDYVEVDSVIKEIQEISDAISMIKVQLERNGQAPSEEKEELEVDAASINASNDGNKRIWRKTIIRRKKR